LNRCIYHSDLLEGGVDFHYKLLTLIIVDQVQKDVEVVDFEAEIRLDFSVFNDKSAWSKDTDFDTFS